MRGLPYHLFQLLIALLSMGGLLAGLLGQPEETVVMLWAAPAGVAFIQAVIHLSTLTRR